MTTFAALVLTLAGLLPAAAHARPTWKEDVGQALEAAKAKGGLVLLDFYAPWCYSCYYMDQHVLHQPELDAFADRLELVKVDVDSAEGARLKKQWGARFLPTYVILNRAGAEVGRIIGEQVRSEFFSQLRAIADKNSTLDELKSKADKTKDPAAAFPLAREILRIHVKRKSAAEGLAWLGAIPEKLRRRIESDRESQADLRRLAVFQAKEAKDASACLKSGWELLALDLGCQLPYDAWDVNSCVEALPEAQRKPIYATEWEQLQKLLKSRVLVPAGSRCADLRSPVELAHELEGLTGRAQGKTLNTAIALARSDLGEDPKSDRSMADNLRAFLDMAGRDADLEAFYAKLTAAFPDEYVYYARFAKFLAKRNRHEEALAQLDKAAPKAYGANRLKVMAERAKSLSALGRKDEAKAVVEEGLKDNPASFPDEAATLTRLKSELQP